MIAHENWSEGRHGGELRVPVCGGAFRWFRFAAIKSLWPRARGVNFGRQVHRARGLEAYEVEILSMF
jgi:hypothetical protein